MVIFNGVCNNRKVQDDFKSVRDIAWSYDTCYLHRVNCFELAERRFVDMIKIGRQWEACRDMCGSSIWGTKVEGPSVFSSDLQGVKQKTKGEGNSFVELFDLSSLTMVLTYHLGMMRLLCDDIHGKAVGGLNNTNLEIRIRFEWRSRARSGFAAE